MVKELAWREGVQEGLAVEVTCGMLSQRYIAVKHFFDFPKRENINAERTEGTEHTEKPAS